MSNLISNTPTGQTTTYICDKCGLQSSEPMVSVIITQPNAIMGTNYDVCTEQDAISIVEFLAAKVAKPIATSQ